MRCLFYLLIVVGFVVGTSTINCLERLVSEMSYYVLTEIVTLSSPVVSNGYSSKCSGPYWSNPPFFDTRALRTERQSAWMSKS